MKIGFLGNTNNYPFIIASQMRNMGCEVVLYVDAPAGDMLNRPEHHASDIEYPYPVWIKEKFSLRTAAFTHLPNIFLREVLKELNTCDAVILNDYGHRFKKFLKPSVLSISMFSGGDLEIMADYENVRNMKMINPKLRFIPDFVKKAYAKFSVNQLRNGISKAALISYFPEGMVPNGEQFLKEIFHGKSFARFNHFHIVTEGFNYSTPPDNKICRIFSLTRFMWKTPFPPGRTVYENKGNDIMLRGIALFLKTSSKPLDIHFVEKGLHLQESKDLIDELGFAKMVTWHKEMPFKELKDHISKADIVFEQMGKHFVSGGLYAMLMGRPLIANARPEIFEPLLNEPTPICHALNENDICDWLQKLTSDTEIIHSIGKKSREYVLKHFDIINETLYFKNFIQEKLANRYA